MKRIYTTLPGIFISILVFSQNPQLLKEVVPGNNSGTIQQIVKTSTYTFFNQNDGGASTDRSLYRTDGTPAGTIKINLTYPGYISTKADKLTAFGNKIVFAGDNFTNYGEIWASDGTQSGTVAIERFQPINNKVPVVEINTMGNYAYYSVINKDAGGVNRAYLRRTDGTAAGTSEVYDFSAFTGIPQVVFLTPMNGILYFIVYDQGGTGTDQLWRSDGTNAGTYMVYDFTTANPVASFLMVAGSNIYVMTVSTGVGNVLWKSDGTGAGTVQVKTIRTTPGGNNYPPFIAIDNYLVFAGLDGNGKELWVTDGTAAGTNMVADINPGSANSNPANFAFLNDTLYFSATTAASGNELWMSDGTVAGTSIVKDINPGVGSSNPQWLTLSGNTILFNANNGSTGGELWITDGTTANTVQASDMNPGAGGAFPNLLTKGNPVFFAANNGVSGFEVFKYDNTDGIAGLHKIYVNDGSQAGDIFTTTTGSNTNQGTRTAPVASVNYAVSIAQPGDTIVVDAGTFTEQVTIDKGITIIGAGQNLSSILKPAITAAPPGSFTEQGVIQTAQSIVGDVHISNLSVTGDYTVNVTPIIIQSGGSVKNCKLQSGNQGIFVRIDPAINLATKTFVVDGNTINAEYIAVNFAGTRLTATLTNNTIAAFNPGFSSGTWAGADFGTLVGLTVTGNIFGSYVSDGMMVNANNCTISQNSFLGTGQKAINKTGGSTINATCNWYSSPLASVVATKVNSGVTFAPWLIDGTDNSAAIGFQTSATCPVANSYYVNDNNLSGDVFTTAIGNNANPGTPTAPFESLDYAISQVPVGATIFVDAGTYTSVDVTISKSITVLGSNYLISPNNAADPLIANSGRNTETIIANSTWTIGASDISIKGFTFDPQSKTALAQTNNTLDFDNVEISKNIFLAKNTSVVVNLTGKQQSPLVTTNYVINDNRFVKESGGGGNNISINTIDAVQINNNVFTTNNTIVNNARIQNGIVVGSLAGDVVISDNKGYQQNFFINAQSAKKTTISFNKADECNRFAFSSSGNANPNEMEITDNIITNPRSTGGPVISYARSNGVNLSSPNIARIERNTITLNATGLTNVAQALIAPTLDASSANTQVFIRNNKLTITGDFSSLSSPSAYVSAIRYLTNSRYTLVENNEMEFTATNYNGANKFGIGILYVGLQPGTGFNFLNNKFSGFNTSIGVQNNGNGGAYGELPAGVVLNINYNSFTGDVMSINNGTTGQSAQATCNWYGSNIEENITGKISSVTVSYTPWLSNGTDNDVATGFQPVANSCNGYPRKLFVNDNSQAGDVFTTAVGNNANLGTAAAPFGTIDYAYNLAEAGDTIYVDAGVYAFAGELFIQKGITFIGCNYNISPNDATDARNANAAWVAESKITGATLTILSNDLRFKGFTFDPGLRTAVSLNNTPTSNNNFGNLVFENNRFIVTQTSSQVILVGVGTGSTPASGLINSGFTITNNRFEKSAAGSGAVFSVHLVKNVTINNNAFVIGTGGAIRTATAVSMGNVGVVDQVTISNNTIDRFATFVTGNQYANASIVQNKVFNTSTAMNIGNSMPGVSNIDYSNNLLNGSSGIMPFSQYVRTGGSGAGSSTLFKAENNQVSVTAAPVTTTILGAFIFQFGNTVQNQSLIVRGNLINMGGDVSTVEGQFVRAITIRGNLGNATVENNEISFSAVNLQPKNPSNVLPVCPAITLSPENGATAVLQPSAVVNIRNNKVHGFKQSFVVFDPSAGANPYIGFGNLPFGATVNVNDNSFTGDSMSINHSNVGEVVIASCNWYGSAAAQNIITKIALAANLDIIPWLTNGTDNNAATGFQPVAGACDGYPPLIVLDNYSNVTCNGANNGAINITTSYGKAPFTYTWTKDGDPGFVSHAEDPTGLAPGTYHLAILDGNGSNIYITDPEADGPGTIDVTITEPSALTADASGTNNLCFGNTAGTASVNAGGGTAPYSYLWSNGATTSSISNLEAGLYSVTVTDANGCTANAQYQVTQPALLTASITNNSTGCYNAATVSANGGTAPYSYLWSNGATTANISSVPPGNYSVTVTDVNGCTSVANITLAVGEAFNPSAAVTHVSCFGGSNGVITVTNANGTAPFTFSIDGVNFVQGTIPFNFTGLAAGNYTIAVRDVNGCTGFVEKTITQPPQLQVSQGTVQSTCIGSNTGSISLVVTGGSPSFSYLWTGPNNYSSTQSSVSGLAAGIYTVTVTDSKGCSASIPVTVPSFPVITVNANVANVVCRSDANGSIDLTIGGGTGSGFTYLWNNGATTQDRVNLTAGSYNVTITDIGSGCTVTGSYVIGQAGVTLKLNNPAVLNVRGCSPADLGSVSASASGGVRPCLYKLNNGSYQVDSVFTGLAVGSYTVYVIDAYGCEKSATVSIIDDGTDQYERINNQNNNNKQRAAAISVGANINARIASGDQDWFKFTTLPGAMSSYTISVTHPSVVYTFVLYKDGSNTVRQPQSSTATSKTYLLGGDTTFQVQITGSASPVCYTLLVQPPLLTKTVTDIIVKENKPAIDKLNTSVFPNPHQGAFGIKIESAQDGTAFVEIINSAGQLVAEKRTAVNKGGVNIVNFTSMHHAVLFYRVRIGNEISNGKIIGPH